MPHVHLEVHAGVSRGEAREDRRQLVRDEVLGDAEADFPHHGRLDDAPHRLVVEVEDAAGIPQQRLALGREGERAAGALEDPAPDDLLQALHLDAHGRLGASHEVGGGGEAARIGDRREAAQQVDVEVGGMHDQ